ncbi:MAG: hypothetical protein ACE5KM_04625 [Planctomycetaceae bacterium]
MNDAGPNQDGRSTSGSPVSRVAVVLLCLAYVSVTAYFGVRHVLGDVPDLTEEPAGYFFTWNMFPGYSTTTSQISVVGQAGERRFVKLLPATSHRYRFGVGNAATRMDMDRRRSNIEPTLQRLLKRYDAEHPDEPIETVFVVETYWPSRFNLPDDLYREVYGETNPHRKYVRSRNYAVNKSGDVQWSPGDEKPQGQP